LSFQSNVLNTGFSDHEAQIVTLRNIKSSTKRLQQRIFKTVRDYSDGNNNYFNYLLSKEKWEDVYVNTNVNKICDAFLNTVCYYFHIAFPTKRIEISRKRKINWVTPQVKKALNLNKFLNKNRKKSGTPQDELVYKQHKKVYKKLLKTTKQNYYNQKIKLSNNKTKEMWSIVKNELNLIKTPYNKFALNHEGHLIVEPRDIVETFNNYFEYTITDLIRHSNLLTHEFEKK
jgi:hypothetical protein